MSLGHGGKGLGTGSGYSPGRALPVVPRTERCLGKGGTRAWISRIRGEVPRLRAACAREAPGCGRVSVSAGAPGEPPPPPPLQGHAADAERGHRALGTARAGQRNK